MAASDKVAKYGGHVYTYCYCEENIWKLAEAFLHQRRKNEGSPNWLPDADYVVFISNDNKTTPLFTKSGKNVVWDYHVILIRKFTGAPAESAVYDFDAQDMKFPEPFPEYVKHVIRPEVPLRKQYQRKYRVIPSEEFLKTFSSDRSHMLDENGHYRQAPPEYPCLMVDGIANNLFSHFVDMKNASGPGVVMREAEFLKFFAPTTLEDT